MNDNGEKQSPNRANKVVGAAIVLIVIAAIVVLVVMRMGPNASDGAQLHAVVHDGDGQLHELDLDRGSETTIATSKGTNVVAVENGAVYMRDADCDNHDCIRQGRIDAPGQQIICLPHELWIEIVADGASPGEMDVNAAAGNAEGFDVVAR